MNNTTNVNIAKRAKHIQFAEPTRKETKYVATHTAKVSRNFMTKQIGYSEVKAVTYPAQTM